MWLACAVALHSGLAWLIRSETHASSRRSSPPKLDFFELSIVAPELSTAVPEEPTSAGVPLAAPRVSALSARSADAHATPIHESEASVAPEPPLPEASAAPEASAPSARLSLDALGIGGSNPFLGMRASADGPPKDAQSGAASSAAPGAAASAIRAAERRLERYMVAGMLEHDRAVGTARAGHVALALKESAALVASPVNGQAEFLATIDATGLVVALTAVRASSRFSDWQSVAAHALKQLAKKRVRVPKGTSGLEIRLSLSSRSQLPGGRSPGMAMSLLDAPIKGGEGKNSTRVGLLPLHASADAAPIPDPERSAPQGVPLMQRGITVGSLEGDPADIGSPSRRIVHVTITEERPL